jgi:8-oxo-dGTP diphosphatase
MGLVVGAAVIRDGQVLAARRTSPPEAAGRWEFPGGKVEAGETPEAALVREIDEELDCRIAVGRWLAGEEVVAGGRHTLRVAVARLVDGEPHPHEHDRVRWLVPEELDDVDWLSPDRPFLDELRELLLDGARLDGGNVGGAVRIGPTVRRPVGPWTPAVHAYLRHLEARGLPCVPRVHGTDARGREVLDHLPGEVVDVDDDELTDARLASLAAWSRRLHAAAAGFDHPGPWRFFGVDRPTLVAHNDLAAYNACFDGDRLAGVFDWDLSGPSTPLMELAHLAWTSVPLFRPLSGARTVARLRIVADAYGDVTAAEVLTAVPARVQVAIDGIRGAVAAGDVGMQVLAATGEPERTERALAAFRERLPALEDGVLGQRGT